MKLILILSMALLACVAGIRAQGDCPPSIACVSSMTGDCLNGSNNNEITVATGGCLVREANKTSWLSLCFSTSGIVRFSLTPDGAPLNNMDFAIWGPNAACPPTTAPIRCSIAPAILSKVTGMNSSLNLPQIDLIDDSLTGNGWVGDLSVAAGQSYLMCISNFTNGSNNWSLNFTGSTAIFVCTALGVELMNFEGQNYELYNHLSWKTATEHNNHHFSIERSVDGINWSMVTSVDGFGTSDQEHMYAVDDALFLRNSINYYRLIQTDYDGAVKLFEPLVGIDNRAGFRTVTEVINIQGQIVPPDTKGLVILHYSDGMIEKRFND